MAHEYYIDTCTGVVGLVGDSYVTLFLFSAAVAAVSSGIALALYLYFSDGPVLSLDKSLVRRKR